MFERFLTSVFLKDERVYRAVEGKIMDHICQATSKPIECLPLPQGMGVNENTGGIERKPGFVPTAESVMYDDLSRMISLTGIPGRVSRTLYNDELPEREEDIKYLYYLSKYFLLKHVFRLNPGEMDRLEDIVGAPIPHARSVYRERARKETVDMGIVEYMPSPFMER